VVYTQPINSVEDLTGRVVAVGAQIREDREVFSRVCESMVRRAQACITYQRQHFQHLLRVRYAKSNIISGYKVSKWIIIESKRIDFEVIFLTGVCILKALMSLMTYHSRYWCRYLLTALEL
jgi:hypothetical protein